MKLETFQAMKAAYEMAKSEVVGEYCWQSLAYNGLIVEAIIKYRVTTGCSLREAKAHVDAFVGRI